MSPQLELGVIACQVHAVFQAFRDLAATPPHPESPFTKFENESTRFKMWVGNLGAHQSGRSSLDYRLREAPHLHDQVIYLLKDLRESLEDARTAIAPHRPPSTSYPARPIEEDEAGSSEDGLLSDSDDTLINSDVDDGDASERRLSVHHSDVTEAIDCLLRLSVAIAHPAPHERARKFGAGKSEDVSYYEPHDILHVRDKFPRMDPDMAEALGRAITRRRQFFKYREAHHQRLAAGLDDAHEAGTSGTERGTGTVASSLPDHLKIFGDLNLKAGIIDEDASSETGMSQTSYATSAGYQPASLDEGQEPPPALRVPTKPPSAESEGFECPFCYRMISASTREAWKRHVFADLRPYTCLFTGCIESNADFDRRHRWQSHISQYHWRSWICPFRCKGSFASNFELKDHLGHRHLPKASDEQLNAATILGERKISADAANECPLCKHTVVGMGLYVKHVGRHLEQLALFALPTLEDKDPEGPCESSDGHSAGSSEAPIGETRLGEVEIGEASSRAPISDEGSDEYETVAASALGTEAVFSAVDYLSADRVATSSGAPIGDDSSDEYETVAASELGTDAVFSAADYLSAGHMAASAGASIDEGRQDEYETVAASSLATDAEFSAADYLDTDPVTVEFRAPVDGRPDEYKTVATFPLPTGPASSPGDDPDLNELHGTSSWAGRAEYPVHEEAEPKQPTEPKSTSDKASATES